MFLHLLQQTLVVEKQRCLWWYGWERRHLFLGLNTCFYLAEPFGKKQLWPCWRRCVTGGGLWSFRRRWPFLVCCLCLMLVDQMWALSCSCHHAFALPSWTLNPLELQVSKHAFFGMPPWSWCFITAIEKGPRQCGSTTVLSSCRRYTPQILEPLSPLVRRHHSPRFLSVDKTLGTVGLGFFSFLG